MSRYADPHLHLTLLSRELIAFLEVPVSRLPLRFKFPPQGALLFAVLILSSRSLFSFVSLLKTHIAPRDSDSHLEALSPSGSSFPPPRCHDFEVAPFMLEVPLALF